MRTVILAFLLLVSCNTFGKDRKWQAAKLVEAGTSETGSVAVPMPTTTTATVISSGATAYGTAITAPGLIFAVPVRTTYYVFRGESVVYVVYFNPLLHWKQPNLTLGAMVKIAPDGNKLYFINDDGKQAHLPLAGKRLIEGDRKN